MLISIDRYQLRNRLLLTWAAASLAGLFLLKTWIAVAFIAVLSYVMRTIWKTTLRGRASHELIKVTRTR